MLLTDTCGSQGKECASPNDGRGGFNNRAGKEACKWSNGGWNPAPNSVYAGPRASLRLRRGLRSCPPQRVVGSPMKVTYPSLWAVRSCAAQRSTPPSVPYILFCLYIYLLGLIPGTQIQGPGCISRISRRVPPGISKPRRVFRRAEAVVLCTGWSDPPDPLHKTDCFRKT